MEFFNLRPGGVAAAVIHVHHFPLQPQRQERRAQNTVELPQVTLLVVRRHHHRQRRLRFRLDVRLNGFQHGLPRSLRPPRSPKEGADARGLHFFRSGSKFRLYVEQMPGRCLDARSNEASTI